MASRYSRRLELCEYRTELEYRGHSIPARWLLGEHQVHGLEASRSIEAGESGPIPADKAVLFANDDVEDVLQSSFMLNFTEEPRTPLASRGGRHVEAGIFLGLKYAAQLVTPRQLFIIGPIENVFHALPEVDGRFDTFQQFIDALDKEYITL